MADLIYGLNGTGDWQSDSRPKNWRESILRWWPNADMPLTAMTSKMRSKSLKDPETKWWVQDFLDTNGTVTEIYTDSAMTAALASDTTAAGTALFLKVAQADASKMVPGSTLRLYTNGYPQSGRNVYVLDRQLGGASSKVSVQTLKLDAAVTTKSLQHADRYMIIGSAHAEGSTSPKAIVQQPDKFENQTQIIRTALEITGTAMETTTRYGTPEYARQKRDALEMHGRSIEMTLLFGELATLTGENGKPLRFMDGLVPWAFTNTPAANISQYTTGRSAKTWESEGKDWLNEKLEILFRQGSSERFCICGNQVLSGLNKLAEMDSSIKLEPNATSYGIKIRRWETNFGVINFKTHPLFNMVADLRKTALIFNLANIEYAYLQNRDTKFLKSKSTDEFGEFGFDGKQEGWITECTAHWGIPEEYGILMEFDTDAA